MNKKYDIEHIEKRLKEFDEKIQRLKELEIELNTLDVEGLEDKALDIRRNLKNPSKLPELEAKIKQLKKAIADRAEWKKTLPGLLDTGTSLSKKGTEHFNKKEYDSALEYYQEALRNFQQALSQAQELKDTYKEDILQKNINKTKINIIKTNWYKSKAISQVALANYDASSFDSALEDYKRAKDILNAAILDAEKIADESLVKNLKYDLSVLNKNIENCYIGIDRNKVKALYEKAQEKFSEAENLENIGRYLVTIDKLQEAEGHYRSAFRIANERKFVEDIINLKNLLSAINAMKERVTEEIVKGGGELEIPEVEVTATVEPKGPIIKVKKEERYLKKEKLGSGGMGTVYLAYDKLLKRDVALKLLRKDWSASKEKVERFLNEASIAAQLEKHKSIIKIHNIGMEDEIPFIDMEFVKGRDLKKELEFRKVFTPQEAIGIAKEICDALKYTHKKGVIHRDIKPSNILLLEPAEISEVSAGDIITFVPEIKVNDFGIAAAKGEIGKGMEGYTLEYASPEQIKGEKVDFRTDIYSLGITLYHLVTGLLPFTGPNMKEQILTSEPINPQEHRKEIGSGLSNVIMKCLSKNRKDRYQNAKELLKALQTCQKDIGDLPTLT